MSSLGAPFVWCEDGERSQQPARRGELTSNRLGRAQRSTRLARLSALVSIRTSRLASILLHRILLSQSPRCSTHYWKGAVDVRLSADPAPPRLVVSSTRLTRPAPSRYARSSLYSLEVPPSPKTELFAWMGSSALRGSVEAGAMPRVGHSRQSRDGGSSTGKTPGGGSPWPSLESRCSRRRHGSSVCPGLYSATLIRSHPPIALLAQAGPSLSALHATLVVDAISAARAMAPRETEQNRGSAALFVLKVSGWPYPPDRSATLHSFCSVARLGEGGAAPLPKIQPSRRRWSNQGRSIL